MTTPLSFEELLVRAGDPTAWLYFHHCGPDCNEQCRHAANSEMHNRLSSAVRSGLVPALREAINLHDDQGSGELPDKMSKLLAILDGKGTP